MPDETNEGPWDAEQTTAGRLAELKAKSERRKYEEKREAAGFGEDSDYNKWLELEELRYLTLDERRASNACTDSRKITISNNFAMAG